MTGGRNVGGHSRNSSARPASGPRTGLLRVLMAGLEIVPGLERVESNTWCLAWLWVLAATLLIQQGSLMLTPDSKLGQAVVQEPGLAPRELS